MRWFVLIVLLIAKMANAQVADIQVNWTCNGPLIECLEKIERDHPVRFAYRQSDLEGIRWEGANMRIPMDSLLMIFKRSFALEYRYFGDQQIILTRRPLRSVVIRVEDAETQEVVPNATVWIREGERVHFSDRFGLVPIQTRNAEIALIVQRDGYHPFIGVIKLGASDQLLIEMQPYLEFEAVLIRSTDTSQMLPSRSYDEVLPSREPIAGFGGEVDALNNIKLKGGILNVGLGEPGLVVRGGGPDQNLITIDGIPVYNTFHILGLYSIFNSSTINSIRLHKDAFPAQYGGRLSSVVDVSLNNGDKDELRADADVGIISSGFSANGPMDKDKLSFSLSARRSYAHLFTIPVQEFMNQGEESDNTTELWYFDVFAKLHSRINERHELKWTFYNGGDQFGFGTSLSLRDSLNTSEITTGNLRWRNLLQGLQWHGIVHPKLFITGQTSWSNYQLQFNDAFRLEQAGKSTGSMLETVSGLSEWRTTLDADWFPSLSHHVQFGTGAISYQFQPFRQNYSLESNLGSLDTSVNIAALRSTEYLVYAEEHFNLQSGVLSAGLRYSHFVTNGKTYHSWQPRLFLTKNLNPHLQFRMSLTEMTQFLHLLPNNNLGMPIDIWLPVTRDIPPLNSFQVSGGFRFRSGQWTGGLMVYAKNYRNLLEYRPGSNFLAGADQWEQYVLRGKGSASGIELMGEYDSEHVELLMSYAYGRSTRIFDQINRGATFYSKYDRPHSVDIYARFALSDRTQLLISFVYSSGNPITLPVSRYATRIGGSQVTVGEFSERNNYRLPSNNHLDIAFKNVHRIGSMHGELVYGLYNIYNRLNPFMVYIGLDENLQTVLKMRSYLPVMPMLKYRLSL